MPGFSSVTRIQEHLVRCLGGCNNKNRYTTTLYNHNQKKNRMQSVTPILEADAVSIIKSITPTLDPSRHKGQAGKIAVVGGCREYTGAPYFSAISALKIGADLSHVFCTKDAAPVIKCYSPELIVHPILEESYSVSDDERKSSTAKVLAEVDKWMERFDCLVIGPGLGRDPYLLLELQLLYFLNEGRARIISSNDRALEKHFQMLLHLKDCVSDIIKHARQSNVPVVIDGDGLFLVTNCPELVSGYPLAVLTPNVNEYKRLVQKVLSGEVDDQDGPLQLINLSKGMGGVTILRKGKSDHISDGETVRSVSIYGSPRRCGGQGDILSGSVALFLSWARQQDVESKLGMNPTMLGCIAGSILMRKAASFAFENKKRSTLTSDIIECLGRSMEALSPVN